jgi:serine/threonine-protein kinase
LWPELLPGGEAVLFTITMRGGIEQAQVAVLDLRTGERRTVLRGGSHAQYVAPGYLVYGVAGTLRAVAFNVRRLETVGAPVPVVEGVAMTPQGGIDASVADDGTLVYVRGQGEVQRTLVWVDRQGQEELLPAPPGLYSVPRLSPDGTKLAVVVNAGQEADISIWDLVRQTLTRFTFGGGLNNPVWTPDGRRIVWGSGALFWQAADGTGTVERLAETNTSGLIPYSVSPDGTRLVLRADGPGTGADLMVLTLDGKRAVTPLIQTTFNERNADISPDGRWLAYESDESGQSDVYVRPFPAVDAGRWQVSTAGGRQPSWARSGREIFYRALDGALLGVSVEVVGAGSFRVGTPARVLEGRYYTGGPFSGRMYAASSDGRRFLMIKESSGVEEAALSPAIVVVQNWVEELKRLMPTN